MIFHDDLISNCRLGIAESLKGKSCVIISRHTVQLQLSGEHVSLLQEWVYGRGYTLLIYHTQLQVYASGKDRCISLGNPES